MCKEKISIIMPIYNGEKYLRQTLENILKSSYKNIEIVAVNDGSSDSSRDLISEISKKDSRVVLLDKENGGVISARNAGVDYASGDFLCFCDQDDIVKPDMYRQLYKKIQIDGSDMAMCSSGRSIDGKESPFDTVEDAVYEGKQIAENILYPLLLNGYSVPTKYIRTNRYPHIWNCMFNREFWEKNELRFRAYVNFEDDLLLKTEALCRAEKVSTIAYVGYLWRVNLESETYAHKYVKNIGEKQQQALDDIMKSLTFIECTDVERTMLCHVTLCKQYLDAVHNATSIYRNKNGETIKAYFDKNIYNRDFEDAIAMRKYLRKGRVKPSIILPLLSHHYSYASYYAEKVLDAVLKMSLHSQALTKIERRIKRG